MRIAIVAESFLPQVNGLASTVAKLARHLRLRGHDPLVVAPGPGPDHHDGIPVVRAWSVGLPGYRECRLAAGGRVVRDAMARFQPDVVHLASPVVLGRHAGRVAAADGTPIVASYHTDLAGFSRRYRLGATESQLWALVRAGHQHAALTLAPSSVSAWQLAAHGIEPVERWPRGVDGQRFHPSFRDEGLRRRLAPGGELLVGYVGRLAREKQLERLAPLTRLRGVRVVVVGDGPRRRLLERRMPQATFLGFRRGAELSRLVASFDVFVHPGIDETFCQAIQEAMAAGVAVVAPAAGGPLDLVRHGETGLLWTPQVPETLVGATRTLLADAGLRAHLGAAAHHAAAANRWPAVLDRAIEHYERLAAPASRACLSGAEAR